MIVVGVLVGVLPLLNGFGTLFKRSAARRRERGLRPAMLEREVLARAREVGGRVTVVQLAAATGHPLDEIQATLDSMTVKGYVSQEILATGVIRYDFPSLITDENE
jgi:hypothetical protein